MTTKEKFLNEIKEVMGRYGVSLRGKEINGTPFGMVNNLPNYSITGMTIDIPNEDVKVEITSKEFVDFLYR